MPRRHHRNSKKTPPLPQTEISGDVIQVSPGRILWGRLNGRKGGLATSRRYGKEFKERRATLGGQATLAKYGLSYYSEHFKRIWVKRKAKMAAEKKAALLAQRLPL